MNLYSIPSLIGFLANAFLGIYIFAKDEKSPLNRTFSLFCMGLAAWCFGEFMGNYSVNADAAFSWIRIGGAGLNLMPAFFLHFMLILNKKTGILKKKIIYLFIYSPPVFFSFLLWNTNLMINNIELSRWGYVFNPGEFYELYVAWTMGIFLTGLYLCLRLYRETGNRREKIQAVLIAVGLVFPASMGMITDIILPLFHIRVFHLGNLSSVVMVLVVAYAMLRFRIFVIKPATAAENILSAMSDSLFLVDHESIIKYVNNAAVELLGYSRQELLEKRIDVIFQESNPGSAEKRLISKDGVGIPVLFSVSVMKQEDDNEKMGIVCIASDITERIKTEKALRESEEKYRDIIENIEEGYWEIDLKGNFTFFNNKMVEVMQYSEDELLGMNNRQYMTMGMIKEVFRTFNEVYTTGISKDVFEYEIIRKDGEKRFIGSSISLIRDSLGNGIGFRGITRDITDRIRMEIDMIASKDEAESANRAKSAFLTNVSHELRTPLNGILGFSEILLGKGDSLPPKHREYVEHILNSGEHLLALVNDILDISRIESNKLVIEKQPFDLKKMLEILLVSMRNRADAKGLIVEEDLSPGLGLFRGDEIRLRQAVYNLLSNAIKFTEPEKKIGLRAFESHGVVSIIVWDEGRGIEPERLDTIQNPFEQVKTMKAGKPEGTGLGLAIVRKLVELHLGMLSIESEPGKGSSFTITLPV